MTATHWVTVHCSKCAAPLEIRLGTQAWHAKCPKREPKQAPPPYK